MTPVDTVAVAAEDGTVRGDELREGDVVIGIYGDRHRIARFAPYPGLRFASSAGGARRAYDDTGHWRCTVADHHRFHREPAACA